MGNAGTKVVDPTENTCRVPRWRGVKWQTKVPE